MRGHPGDARFSDHSPCIRQKLSGPGGQAPETKWAKPNRPPSPVFADTMGVAHPQNILAARSQNEGRQRSRGPGGQAPETKWTQSNRPPSPVFADTMGVAHPQNILAARSQHEGRQRSRGPGATPPKQMDAVQSTAEPRFCGYNGRKPIRKTFWLLAARMRGDKGRGGPGAKPPKQNGRSDCPDSERRHGGMLWVDQFTQALAGDLAPHLLMAQRLLREVA